PIRPTQRHRDRSPALPDWSPGRLPRPARFTRPEMKTLARTLAEDTVKQLVAVRRDLHQHPETAFEEVRTAGVVAERLRKLGLEPRTGVAKTGVIATVRGAKPGRTVLLRA